MSEDLQPVNKDKLENEVSVPPEATDLVQACIDLNSSAMETNTSYLIVGSIASVCAVGEYYRSPGDVDGWYDVANAQEFRESLIRRGYSHSLVNAKGSPFPNPLERFEKGKSIIEVRGANYTERGIEYPMRLPIPGIPLDRRPMGQLVYPTKFAEPRESYFGGARVLTTKKEALWISLNSTLPLIQVVGDKDDKRLQDLEKLSERLDENVVKEMLEEEPGVYLGNRPIVTTNRTQLLDLLVMGIRLKQQLIK